MGICRCAENKHCGIHFFKKVDSRVYEEKKEKFESKHSKKNKGNRTPEFEVEFD